MDNNQSTQAPRQLPDLGKQLKEAFTPEELRREALRIAEVIANIKSILAIAEETTSNRVAAINEELVAIAPQEVKDLLIELDYKKSNLEATRSQAAQALAKHEAELKELVVALGESITQAPEDWAGPRAKLSLIYQPGRVSWDTKKLEGLALAHPTIEQCKIIGKPFATVSIKLEGPGNG